MTRRMPKSSISAMACITTAGTKKTWLTPWPCRVSARKREPVIFANRKPPNGPASWRGSRRSFVTASRRATYGIIVIGEFQNGIVSEMKIEQFRILCEVVDQGFSMSRAAAALDLSQPNISKQMRLLEEVLAVELLLRRGGRIIGMTEPGREVLKVARRIVLDAGSMKSIG